MVRLEQAGMQGSPAYQSVQAQLEMMGVKAKATAGRRFSETGKEVYNKAEHLKKVLKHFLESETSRVKGYKDYRSQVWKSADEKYNLSESGITEDDYMDFWKNYPDKEKDRLFGSEIVIELISTYKWKNKELKNEQELTGQEIADAIQGSKDYKTALKKLGLTTEDIDQYDKAASLGKLDDGWQPANKDAMEVFGDARKQGKNGRRRRKR